MDISRLLKKDAPDPDMSSKSEIYLASLNIKRILSLSKLVFIYLVCCFALPSIRFDIHSPIFISLCVSAFLSAIAAISIHLLYKKEMPPHKSIGIYRSYWLFLLLSLSPLFIRDTICSDLPFNTLLFFCLAIIVPVFSVKDLKALYLFFTIFTTAVSAFFSSNILNIVFIFAIAMISFFVSFYLHSEYTDIVTRLRVESDTDILTGLFNNRSGLEKMRSTLAICRRIGQPCAAYMIGIDYFKNYTDVFGHLKGDEALAMISQCLSDLFGRETDVICRYSEDVFAVLVISKSRVAATEHATRVLKRIEGLDIKSDIESTPVSVSQHLTVSIGISMYWPDIHPELTESTLDKLLASASSQLDKARENGRNRVCSTEGSSF